MKYNGKNIITDDDITLTNEQYFGEKLSDVLGELSSKTDKLAGNVKWIYKYGGVGGTGGGSGSGGGTSTTEYSLFASLDGILMSGQSMAIDGEGSYPLVVRILRPGGARYKITYSYVKLTNGSSLKITKSTILDVDNNYEFSTLVDLNTNNTLTVTAIDNVDGITKQVNVSYITNPYQFTSSLTADGQSVYDEWFINNAQNLKFSINYDIAVNAIVSYYIKFNIGGSIGSVTTEEQILDEKNGTLDYFIRDLVQDVDWEISENNAGTYSIDFIADITVSGKTNTVIRSQEFTLIPLNLYLAIKPSFGKIFTNNDINDENAFNVGSPISFNIKPYFREYQNNPVTIYYLFDDKTELTVTGALRQQTQITYTPSSAGIHTLKIRAIYNSLTSYPTSGQMTYYFKVKSSQTSINWYESGREVIRLFYFGNDFSSQFLKIYDITSGNAYNNTNNNSTINITGLNNSVNLLNKNLNIALGVKFSDLNEDNVVLFRGYDALNNEILSISQDTVQIGLYSADYYLPKKTSEEILLTTFNYNLINVLFRQVAVSGTNYSYEVMVYVDGITEGSVQSYITTVAPIDHISILPFNGMLNFIEISYPTLIKSGDNFLKSPEDIQAYRYWLMYKQSCGQVLSETDELELLSTLGEMITDNNGDSYCEETTALHIANLVDMPVILFTIDDKEHDAKSKLDQSGYGENSVLPEYQVAVKWHMNGLGLTEFTDVSSAIPYQNCNFFIKPQGSSTLSYKCKNYTLSLQNTDEGSDDVYLFSPNFSKTDSKSFLPETSFILKADIVDSSHSNNTAMGKFINANTDKFETNNTTAYGKEYIKNCLDGFPVLVFIKYVESETDLKCYYQGLYNFNLGRTSHFNLGYKNVSVFYNNGICKLNNADSGFTFHSIDVDENQYKPGLVIAEVQGNSPYFDFSQYGDSILYQLNSSSDLTYMFDDFVYGQGLTLITAKEIIQNFVRHTANAGGYLFGDNVLKKSFSTSASDIYGYKDGYSAMFSDGTPKNQVPNYRYQVKRNILNNTYSLDKQINASQEADILRYISEQLDGNDILKPYINYKSLSEYYTICMAFGLVDSVQKNLNIKSWTGDANDKENAMFYCSFYDMDTCLGINNAGLDVNYSAFSDYWITKDEEDPSLPNVYIPSQPIIYRDFSPVGVGVDTSGFYDTPSSYLFAVAKYAPLAFSNFSDEVAAGILGNSPQALWAKWRSKNGPLRNADYFLETYFSNNLGKLPAPLISLNYRNKYFVNKSNSGSFNNLDWMKFHGTRIAKTREWLKGRLHILDAYFNLSENQADRILYYKLNEDGTLEYTYISTGENSYKEYPDAVSDKILDLKENSDVIVLQDLFANYGDNTGNSERLTFKAKTASLLPVYFKIANSRMRYLLSPDKVYKLEGTLNGQQSFSLGGSVNWKYLENINSYITSNNQTLALESDYLENLTANGTRPAQITQSATSNNIKLPAVKSISFSGLNYSGILNIDKTMFRSLDSIDLSESQIQFSISDSNCTTFNLAHIKTDKVSITNCNLIKSINFGSRTKDDPAMTITDLMTISPIGTQVLSTSNLNSGGLNISGTAIKKLNISNLDASPNNQYTRIYIGDDQVLEELTLQGISSISITGCPKLSKINIINDSKGDKLKSLVIQNVGNETNSLYINPTNENSLSGVIDLNQFTELEQLKINNCTNFIKLIIPNVDNKVINVASEAFANNENFTSIEAVGSSDDSIFRTTINITGSGVFENCPNFSVAHGEGRIKLQVDPDCTSINRLFRCATGIRGNINIDDVIWFIENCIAEENKITSITSTFEGNNIEFSKGDYDTNLPRINMAKFNRVSEVTSCFKDTDIGVWYPELFNFGALSETIFATEYMPMLSCGVFVTIDVFKYVYKKLMSFHVTTGTQTMKITDSEGNYSDTQAIKLMDLFYPDTEDSIETKILNKPNIGALIRMDIMNPKIDFTGFFDLFNGIATIDNFMANNITSNGKQRTIDDMPGFKDSSKLDGSGVYHYLQPLQGLSYVRNSFNFENVDDPVELKYFCNWDSLIGNPFKKEEPTDINNNELDFVMYKYITVSDLNTLGTQLLQNENLIGLNNLLRHCYIIGSDTEEIKFTGTSETIVNLSNLFAESFRITSLDTLDSPQYIVLSDDFFKSFPNATIFRGTFYQSMLQNPICDNFFGKKKSDGTYRKEITDLVKCFYNTKWSENARYYHGTVDDNPSPLKNTSDYQPVTIVKNNVLTKSDGGTTYSITIKNLVNFGDDETSITCDNLFVAPDILYGLGSDAKIDECFAIETNNSEALYGILPKNLFKALKETAINNVFKNLNILPYHAANRTATINNTDVINRVYCYIPDGFTNSIVLSAGAFTFNLNLPAIQNKNLVKAFDSFYLLNSKSISKDLVTLSSKSFPDRIGIDDFYNKLAEAGSMNSHDIDFGLNYNLMINLETGEEGFDLSLFETWQVEQLVKPLIGQILSGRLFKTGTTWDSIIPRKMSDSTDIINVDEYMNISRNLILPNITDGVNYKKQRLIGWNYGASLLVYDSQIDLFTEGRRTAITTAYSTITNSDADQASGISIVS